MTFLKKLGQIVAQIAGFMVGLGPLITKTAPQTGTVVATVTSDLTQFANLIATVEAIGASLGTPGPDKLKAAAPLIAQAVLQSEFMVGKKIHDEALFTKASTEGAQFIVDLLNSIHPDSAVVTTVPTA